MSYIPKKRIIAAVNEPFVAAIDAFMKAPKYPLGIIDSPPLWIEGRELGNGELTIKIPLETNGEIGDQKLIVTTSPNSVDLKFSILITFEPAICRLDYDEMENHMNSHSIGTDNIDSIVRGPHYHPWELNKRFFTHTSKPIQLHNAIALDSNIRQFETALRWFCDINKIILSHNHRIELPKRTSLL